LRLLPTTLQDTQLLNEKSMLVDRIIAKFIELRLENAQIPWSLRKSPI
jgi:hypothetical protein